MGFAHMGPEVKKNLLKNIHVHDLIFAMCHFEEEQ